MVYEKVVEYITQQLPVRLPMSSPRADWSRISARTAPT